MPTAMHTSSIVASIWMELTAISDVDRFIVVSADRRAISLVNIGTNTATPKGAARSLKSP